MLDFTPQEKGLLRTYWFSLSSTPSSFPYFPCSSTPTSFVVLKWEILIPLERLLKFLVFKCLPSYDLRKRCMEVKGKKATYKKEYHISRCWRLPRNRYSEMIFLGEWARMKLLLKVLGTVHCDASEFAHLQKHLLHKNSSCWKKLFPPSFPCVCPHEGTAHFKIYFLQALKFQTRWEIPIIL